MSGYITFFIAFQVMMLVCAMIFSFLIAREMKRVASPFFGSYCVWFGTLTIFTARRIQLLVEGSTASTAFESMAVQTVIAAGFLIYSGMKYAITVHGKR